MVGTEKRGDGCWSFREVGCGLLVAVVKEETKGKKLDSGISVYIFFFLSYLEIGSETRKDKR